MIRHDTRNLEIETTRRLEPLDPPYGRPASNILAMVVLLTLRYQAAHGLVHGLVPPGWCQTPTGPRAGARRPTGWCPPRTHGLVPDPTGWCQTLLESFLRRDGGGGFRMVHNYFPRLPKTKHATTTALRP